MPDWFTVSTPFQCGKCKKWYLPNETGVACAAVHPLGECCHYGQTEVHAPSEDRKEKPEEPVIDFAYNSDEWWPQFHGTKRHPASERFHTILRECGELHDERQQAYGRDDDPFANVRASEDWGTPAWVGCMIRATDKLRRLQTAAQKGTVTGESVEDSFRDLANYAIIGLVLYEQDQQKAFDSIDWDKCPCGCDTPMSAPEYARLHGDNADGHDCDCGRDPDCNGQCGCGLRY